MKKTIIAILIIVFTLSGCANTRLQQQIDISQEVQTENTTHGTEYEQKETVTETTLQEDVVSTEPTIVETTPFIIPENDDLVLIEDYIPNIIIDLKYATTDNFTGQIIYSDDQKAMLRYGTVLKLSDAQDQLNKIGLTLVIWDAYRPVDAQFALWEAYPNNKYVANPNNGNYSSHSRGNTVDISIVALDGSFVELPTEFDEFSKQADRNYDDVSEEAKGYALLLEDIMKECGFKPYSAEWWHFTDTDNYDVYLESEEKTNQ